MKKARLIDVRGTGRENSLPRIWRVLLVSLTLLLCGCAPFKSWKNLPATKAEERSISVVAHGWHTGIVISSEDLGPELSFITGYLREGRYYEFGWGEAEFYQAEKVTAPIFLKAVFWSNPSVMHVVSLPVRPQQYFSGSDILDLNLSQTGLQHLKENLRASFKLDGSGHPYPLKRGPEGKSSFFKAEGSYLIINTCNRWTAGILDSGGVPMDTVFTLRAAGVMRQARAAQKKYSLLPSSSPPIPKILR